MVEPKAEREAIIKEFEAVRDKYLELLAKLVGMKVPGVIDPVAAKCNVGEVCHGGSFSPPLEKLGRPLRK